jgi:hypothetical protein
MLGRVRLPCLGVAPFDLTNMDRLATDVNWQLLPEGQTKRAGDYMGSDYTRNTRGMRWVRNTRVARHIGRNIQRDMR